MRGAGEERVGGSEPPRERPRGQEHLDAGRAGADRDAVASTLAPQSHRYRFDLRVLTMRGAGYSRRFTVANRAKVQAELDAFAAQTAE